MNEVSEYKKGIPEVGQWRLCPACKRMTMEWVNLGEMCVWSCSSCGHEESDKDSWTIPVPKGMKFIDVD